ncbi:MAG: type II toxin-antitoxin system HicB family antitoxin [Candidatus Kapabacteria bacterium]|nr:type II toxin-antitoxin system HicB family antitoxin [Candidatus Kapabacteria bacterium]
MNINNYKVFFRPEPEGGYTILVPSLPGCISYGSDLLEAKGMAKEAIELYLESLYENKEVIPNDNETLEYNIMIESYA